MLFRQIDFLLQSRLIQRRGGFIRAVDYISHLLCFYTLTAGPITRFEPYVKSAQTLVEADALKQLHRFANGCVKAFLLSTLALEHAARFLALAADNALCFLPFAALNAIYIYLNFSGYMDIVVAAAAIAGIALPENFNRPWLGLDMQEFWNRWHITLSAWIRDYIFQPLYKLALSSKLKRFKRASECACLLVTFALAGLWHGADLNYLAYGLLQGAGVFMASLYKAVMRRRLGKERFARLNEKRGYRFALRALTLVYVCCSFAFVGHDVISLIWGA